MTFRNVVRNQKGQGITEFALILPLLLLMSLGTIEVANMINTYLTLTHLTREGANLISRDRSLTEADIQADLTAVINAAKPTLCADGAGCTANTGQWYVIYSQIVYSPALGPCGSNLTSGTGNDPDFYRIQRQVTWTRGGFTQTSKIGDDGDCAEASPALANTIKSMAANQTFHVIEVFFNYAPSTLTPVENLLGSALPDLFYDRTIFIQV